jgi:hypothetical protein
MPSLRYIALFLLCTGLFQPVAQAQMDAGIPYIHIMDIPGGEITRTAHFDGNSLWGYINGGADIFLEYGFEKLLVQELNWKTLFFKVEVYKMSDPDAALGILSMNRYRCDNDTVYPGSSCQIPYHTQIACGQFYISVSNQAGSEKAARLSAEIARNLMKQIAPCKPGLPDFMLQRDFEPYMQTMLLYRGNLSLRNRQGPWNSWMGQLGNYQAIIIPLDPKKPVSYLAIMQNLNPAGKASVKYPEPQETLAFRQWQPAYNISVAFFNIDTNDAATNRIIAFFDRMMEN